MRGGEAKSSFEVVIIKGGKKERGGIGLRNLVSKGDGGGF